MHESLLQTVFVRRVWLGRQSHEALSENVGLTRLEAGDEDVDSQIVFVTSEQVRFRDVLGDQVACSLWDGVFATYDLDSLSTTCAGWLEDVHVFEIIHFSIIYPSFVVLRENICYWANLEIFPVFSSLLLYISPKIGFTT